jgi:DNA-binding NarL/FixJ family response regulator
MNRDPSTIRVLTVDDHALLREGIAALVKRANPPIVNRGIYAIHC